MRKTADMIRYTLYQKNPSTHYIYIDMVVDGLVPGKLQLQLPAWRPGRYELGNFAKNVKRVDMYNADGQPLAFTKLSKDLWEVEVTEGNSVKITYSYYAAELNAGACYADNAQMYVNPVHCCMYVVGRREEEHLVELRVPEHYRVACSLEQQGFVLKAANYEELVDSPFIASAALQSESYSVGDTTFHLHFNGECRPDFEKMKTDFSAFTRQLLNFWGDCPTNEYHFLIQVLPVKFYHGVEHKKNTVIAIGPGYAINSGAVYEDVLGVSCHELFHTWNIKTIRPVEMMPYDYTRENYARTGYVYEGFTTYYGDKLLLGSGVFTLQQYFHTLQERLQKHADNFGRYNLSVAHSSWETWLDGYVPGAPYRKTNIYDEGSLVAFMLDVKLLQVTGLRRSLRDVCVLLYERFGKTGKGYSENDIVQLVNEVAGCDFTDFFTGYVYSPADYLAPLKPCFEFLGIELLCRPAAAKSDHHFGFKIVDSGPFVRVALVAPYSPAWKAGLFHGDEIMAVNGMVVKNNFAQWIDYFFDADQIELTVNSGEKLKTVALQRDKKGTTWFFAPQLRVVEQPSPEASAAFEAWKRM